MIIFFITYAPLIDASRSTSSVGSWVAAAICATVIKGSLQLPDNPFHMVERMPCSVYIILRDENAPRLRQLRELHAFGQFTRIQHRTVIPCPTRNRSLISSAIIILCNKKDIVKAEIHEAHR